MSKKEAINEFMHGENESLINEFFGILLLESGEKVVYVWNNIILSEDGRIRTKTRSTGSTYMSTRLESNMRIGQSSGRTSVSTPNVTRMIVKDRGKLVLTTKRLLFMDTNHVNYNDFCKAYHIINIKIIYIIRLNLI